MPKDDFFKISVRTQSDDFKLFAFEVVNQGIDSHLEAFTKSEFKEDQKQFGRFNFNFHRSELPILIRRLRELETEESESWADDIETTLEEEKQENENA